MERTGITIIMAPLQGYTDHVFRQVFARHFKGVDHAVAPFISTMGRPRLKPSRIRDVLPEFNPGLSVTPQILGNNADDFIFLAETLHDRGHKTLNWNLGCPHSKVAKKKRGSGLLPYPETIDALLEKILSGISSELTIKLRLGRKHPGEIMDLLPVLNRYPLKHIILHPRTGIQMYSGAADQRAFGLAAENSPHHFVYNGDITGRDSFSSLKKRFPFITHVMIGRGLLANPFAAEDIKAIKTKACRKDRIKAFMDELLLRYQGIFDGPGHLTGRMKGFWTYLGPSFNHGGKELKAILKATTFDQYKDRVEAFFQNTGEFRHLP